MAKRETFDKPLKDLIKPGVLYMLKPDTVSSLLVRFSFYDSSYFYAIAADQSKLPEQHDGFESAFFLLLNETFQNHPGFGGEEVWLESDDMHPVATFSGMFLNS